MLLQVAGNGFVLARRTETGQFSPVRNMETKNRWQVPSEKMDHLRNVAAWVAFELQGRYSGKIGSIETWNPNAIAEGKPSDSLRVIVGSRRNEAKLETVANTLVGIFGAGGLDKEGRNILLGVVKQVVDDLADLAYSKGKTK